jgi:alanyl-tRNA synthetase
MTARELRDKYIRFFESKGHSRFPSGSLVPYDVAGKLDESLLFNGAGMVQFKPFFRGTATPPSRRLTNAQKCVRTGDIEEVGDASHLTFFEMLGNFSFGDYFKAEAIAYSWEFLTAPEWLGLDPARLGFTIYEEDEESFELWSQHIRAAGLDPTTRIFRLGEETNYWPASSLTKGPPGPCGPNSEMFYWTPSDEPPPTGAYSRAEFERDEEAGKWLEIWNDVFIQFEWRGHLHNPERPSDGYEKEAMDPLPFRSVDTGMGLERTAVVLGGFATVYDTDLFEPILRRIEGVGAPAAPGDGERVKGEESGKRDAGTPRAQGSGIRDQGTEDRSRDGADASDRSDRSDVSKAPLRYGQDPEKDRAIRIVADHARTACFCIADGVLPSNTGRGYVLRRLIRRAVLKGQRVLGFDEPFLHEVYEGVAEAMGEHYTELVERRELIVETLQNEEGLFRKTLERGLAYFASDVGSALLAVYQTAIHADSLGPGTPTAIGFGPMYSFTSSAGEHVVIGSDAESIDKTCKAIEAIVEGAQSKVSQRDLAKEDWLVWKKARRLAHERVFSGSDAFRLYDTCGFPLEVTLELAAEVGLTVDLEGYEAAMREAQARSRKVDGMANVYAENEELVLAVSPSANTQTEFLGYESTEAKAQIVQVSPRFGEDGLTDGKFQVCLDRTPFYAESGGEVGDTGVIACPDFEFKVTDTWKEMGLVWHDVELVRGPAVKGLSRDGILQALNDGIFFKQVEAKVDAPRRRSITRNHTATHLLHAALRSVLGKHVTQAGSLVSPEHLRFDFTHGKAMTAKEIAAVERIVNEESLADREVTVFTDLPIEEAKQKGAMALFGEKYGDRVRMIQVEEFSRELCGGCHVRRTGEIGLFKIVSESSAASGVRRIEAVTGEVAYGWVLERERVLRDAAELLKTAPAKVVPAVEKALEQLREERKRREKAEQAMVRAGGVSAKSDKSDSSDGSDAAGRAVGPVRLWARRYDSVDQKIVASAIDEAVAASSDLVALAAVVHEGKVGLVCKVGPDAQKHGAHAGNIVREVAKIVGGGGGGRPDFATAGGKDPSKVDAALAAAEGIVAAQVA